jgi:hypothetical protein
MSFGFYTPFPVDHTKCGASDSTDFPVGIIVTDARFKSVGNGGHVQSSSGFDLRPYADTSATTAYTFELVSYDPTTGRIEMWVKVPTLSHTVDTPIYLFYGDAGITTDGSSTSTWNSAYKGVWHFGTASSLSLADSTSHGNTITNNGATATTGKVGGGAAFVGASSQSASMPIDFTGSPLVAMSFWLNQASFNNSDLMALEFTANTNTVTGGFFADPNSGAPFSGSASVAGKGSGAFSSAKGYTRPATGWSHWHLQLDISDGTNTVHALYINGTPLTAGSSVNNPGGGNGVSSTLYLASRAGTSFFSTCSLDELRAYGGVTPPADWVTSEYNNQSSPSTFTPTGTEVSLGGSGKLFRLPLLVGLGAGGAFFSNPLG